MKLINSREEAVLKVNIDFQLSRRFGVVERLIFRLVLNGFCNAREIKLSLPIFSDAVIANAVRNLVNEAIISSDIETGALFLSEAIVAVIAMCREQSFEINLPEPLKTMIMHKGFEIIDNSNRQAIELKYALIQELLPNINLDSYRYSIDFIILPQKEGMNE